MTTPTIHDTERHAILMGSEETNPFVPTLRLIKAHPFWFILGLAIGAGLNIFLLAVFS